VLWLAAFSRARSMGFFQMGMVFTGQGQVSASC
jgi:hypothetical protein